jgi:chromosome segregation ATPase
LRFRNQILETDPAEATTDLKAINAFRQIWQDALEIGRKSEANKTVEALAEVEVLSRETEQLENEVTLTENQLTETRQALNHALKDAATTRDAAEEARKNLANEQAKANQFEREKSDLFQQIAHLQRVLSHETSQVSNLKGKLETIETQVLPQIAETRQSLNHALEDATTARQEARQAHDAAAAEQSKAVDSEREKTDLFRQIADLQRLLGDEKARASRLEAKLEMTETQIIPQTAEEMRAKLKRKGIT